MIVIFIIIVIVIDVMITIIVIITIFIIIIIMRIDSVGLNLSNENLSCITWVRVSAVLISSCDYVIIELRAPTGERHK